MPEAVVVDDAVVGPSPVASRQGEAGHGRDATMAGFVEAAMPALLRYGRPTTYWVHRATADGWLALTEFEVVPSVTPAT